MEEIATRALHKLRKSQHGEVEALTALIVREIRETPLTALMPPEQLGAILHDAIIEEFAAPATLEKLTVHWFDLVSSSVDEALPLREQWPPEFVALLTELARTPLRPDPILMEAVLDQEAVRTLLSVVLEDALRRFTQKAKRLEEGVLGGLGGKVAKRSRGFRKSLLGTKAGGIAENLVHSVADEVEQAFERRIKDFLGGASKRAVNTIVQELSKEESTAPLADIQVETLNALLKLPPHKIRKSLDKPDTKRIFQHIQDSLYTWAQQPPAKMQIVTGLRKMALDAGTLENLYAEEASKTALHRTLNQFVATSVKKTIDSNEFEVWWHSLFK